MGSKQKSGGLKKKHSEAQKNRYKAHFFRLADNKIAKIERHLRRVDRQIRRNIKRGRKLKQDKQAEKRLEELKG